MAHTIANGYSLFKKRMVLCESLRVTTEKTGLDWFSRGPLMPTKEHQCIGWFLQFTGNERMEYEKRGTIILLLDLFRLRLIWNCDRNVLRQQRRMTNVGSPVILCLWLLGTGA